MSKKHCSRLNANCRNRVKVLIALIMFASSTGHALGQRLSMAVPKSQDRWSELVQRGSEATAANQYWIAEPTLLQALRLSEQFGGTDLRLAKSLGELGHLYTIRGDYSKAEPYLVEELTIKERVFGDDIGELVPPMGCLITFYLNADIEKKAIPLTEDLLSMVEGKLRNPGSLTKTTVKLAKGAPLQGWAGSAAPIARDKLVECAVTCDNLGDLYYRQHNNFDLADRLFKAALDLKATVFGKQHISLANSYDRIGSLCMTRNELKEAESYLNDALTITEKVLGTDDPHVYARLDQLAKCEIKEGKFEQAEALYLRAQNFWKDSEEPSKNGEQVRAAYALGSLYTDEKKYEAAAPYLQQALQLAEQDNGPDSINLIPYLQRYAYNLYYLGQKADSEQLKARASTISGAAQP